MYSYYNVLDPMNAFKSAKPGRYCHCFDPDESALWFDDQPIESTSMPYRHSPVSISFFNDLMHSI